MKSETAAHAIDVTTPAPGLVRFKLSHGRGTIRVAIEKRHGDANSLFLELGGSRKFEVGNDCDTCHFWFKRLEDPLPPMNKKLVNLPKTIQLPRPVDEALIQELSPLFELLEKGEYSAFETSVYLSGPYAGDDESCYFFNSEFHELWDITDPAAEDLLSEWEHYEGERPRVFRHGERGFLEKQFDFIIPLVPRKRLNEENIKLYQSMISEGDRPRILLLGVYQRAIPQPVRRQTAKVLHSFFAGFTLDGHHKLAAYRRSRVPARFLVVLSHKASKYTLMKDEGTAARAKFDERLATLAAG